MSAEKRKRSVNFSVDEKMRFLHILQQKGEVIISKVTSHDFQTNRLKEDAWKEITDDLNSSGIVIRTTENLKKLWQKLKTEAKTFKSLGYQQTNGNGQGPTKKMDDPILELVADITGYGSSGIKFVTDCNPEVFYTEMRDASVPEPLFQSTSTDTHSTGLDIEEPKTPPPIPSSFIVVQHSVSPSDEPLKDFCSKGTELVKNVAPKSRNHLKRRWPTVGYNKQSNKFTKLALNYNFASEQLKCEKEKRALIELQKRHMTEEHTLRIKNANLKTKILEAVLKKIQDEKPVDPDLLKIVSNL